MTDFKNITILCDVIDNFGDIGVAYRLAKSLTELDPALKLTLVCSNLESFASMNPEVDPAKKIQEIKYKNSLWTIIDWNLDEKEVTLLKEKQLPVSDFSFPVILECFQCGRPDWIENIIFSPENTLLHYIFNIEYIINVLGTLEEPKCCVFKDMLYMKGLNGRGLIMALRPKVCQKNVILEIE